MVNMEMEIEFLFMNHKKYLMLLIKENLTQLLLINLNTLILMYQSQLKALIRNFFTHKRGGNQKYNMIRHYHL